MARVIQIQDGISLLERILHPRNVDRIPNFGPNAFIYVQDEGLYRRILDAPLNSPIHVTIGGSADDGKEGKLEDIAKFKQPGIEFGRLLGRRLENYGRDVIVSTGGCPNVPDWITKGLTNSNAILVALIPWTMRRSNEGLIDDRMTPDPRDCPVDFLSQYHFVVGTDMDVDVRSILNGTADIAFIIHGGPGSLIEAATEIDQRGIVAGYNPNGERGIVKKLPDIFNLAYKKGLWVYFRNSDPNLVIKRAFAEYEAKARKLWEPKDGKIKTSLVAVVCYKVRSEEGERYFINIRTPELPVTYYHRRRAVKIDGREITELQYFPLAQIIVDGSSMDEVMSLLATYDPDIRGRVKVPRERERGAWVRYYDIRHPLDAMVVLYEALKIGGRELFYSNTFDKNLRFNSISFNFPS